MKSLNHAFIHTNLVIALCKDYDILTELTLDLGNKEYRPELCGYPKNTIKPNYIKDVIRMVTLPTIVAEVLSPTQGTQEVLDKIERALDAGIKEAIFVTPSAFTLQVFHPGGVVHTWVHDRDKTIQIMQKDYDLGAIFLSNTL